MKTYQVASGAFGCDVQITFNEAGTLIKYEVLNENAKVKAVIRLHTNEADFLEVMKTHKMEVFDVNMEVTYEMLYEAYDYKVDKQPGEKAWNKLPKYKKIRCYRFVKTYLAQIKRDQVKQKYISTYINSEIYM